MSSDPGVLEISRPGNIPETYDAFKGPVENNDAILLVEFFRTLFNLMGIETLQSQNY